MSESTEKVKPSIIVVSELRRTIKNIEAVCDIVETGVTKHSIPLVRRELGKHMQNMDARYLNLVKELEELESK